ncbi:hypothetical protein ELH93_19450 [Rhizobium leguminosarum]|uniref:hypothetical protein n=1 Tax=Rhizobium leguminosarum TaxID=384 RepID=UPI00102F76FE|nr:hypothetical protein [Rhizobium leguminosarum]TAY34665.1 hypothetical protein ELH93_19450 [Rhizobium leguminosarum]
MADVNTQIEHDQNLKKELARVRSHLASLGLADDLNRFLLMWDESIRSSDFALVAAEYPRLIARVLVNLRPHCGRETQANASSDLQDLLQAAFSLSVLSPTATCHEHDFEEAKASLAGMLEMMQMFDDPDTYLIEQTPSEWTLEHYDYEECTGRRPILLREFIFELECFLGGALDTKRQFLGRHGLAAGT